MTQEIRPEDLIVTEQDGTRRINHDVIESYLHPPGHLDHPLPQAGGHQLHPGHRLPPEHADAPEIQPLNDLASKPR